MLEVQKEHMDKISKYILLIGVLIVASIILTFWFNNQLNKKIDRQFDTINLTLDTINLTLTSLNDSLQLESETHFMNTISNINPSVVSVLSSPPHNDSGSNNVIYLDNGGQAWNLGTGFSIDSNGDILTANHVVDNVKTIVIILPNGTILPVSRMVNIPDLDVAILYVNSSLPPVKLQNVLSSSPVGMSIAFIGYPFTTEINGKNSPVETTVKGTVSAIIPYTYKNQVVYVYVLGAAANKGNSGGPVFSLKTGEVIGIINEKTTQQEGIAISTVITKQLVTELLSASSH